MRHRIIASPLGPLTLVVDDQGTLCALYNDQQKYYPDAAALAEDVDRTAGIHLTEHFAMTPTAAVSGWYFSHPEARYFGVGRLDRDQVADYARRKGWTVAEAEKWLAPNLGYEPEE